MQINKPLSIIILVLVTAILAFLFVWPKYQDFGAAKVALAQKEGEYEGESAYFQKIVEITKELEGRKDSLSKIDNALPQDLQAAPMIYFFQTASNQTGLVLKTVTFSNGINAPAPGAPTDVKKDVKDIVFALELAGNYGGLKNFLVSLENSARLFEVDSLTIAPLQSLQNLVPGSSQPQSRIQTYNFKLQVRTHTY